MGNSVWSHYRMCTGVLPFSRRLRSSLLWQTICGPWCHWLRSSGCHNVLSDPPAAGFSTDPSSRSWSGRGIAPRKKKKYIYFLPVNMGFVHARIDLTYCQTTDRKHTPKGHVEISNHTCLPSQRQSSRRSGWVDLQRTEGSQLPFHRWGLQGPTSPQLCYSPKKIQLDTARTERTYKQDIYYSELKHCLTLTGIFKIKTSSCFWCITGPNAIANIEQGSYSFFRQTCFLYQILLRCTVRKNTNLQMTFLNILMPLEMPQLVD